MRISYWSSDVCSSDLEIISQVVIIGDVAPRTAAAVAARPMDRPADPARRAVRPGDIAQADGIGHEEGEQRHRIGTGPLPPRPGPIPALGRAAGGGRVWQYV